jgi:predicted nucleotidyltransferase
MNLEILSEVQKLCREKGVELLYIFFTGSRAYGYNKEDSDYDTLFVFKRPLADYFRVHPLPDEIKVEGKDIKGWDVRKFCHILSKSGWNAYEALHVRECYALNGHANVKSFEHLRHLANNGDFYEPMKVAKTMVGCSARDLAKYEEAEGNKKLKYFLSYARMVMSAMYCVTHTTYPPVDFRTLARMTLQSKMYAFIMDELVQARKEDKDATPYVPLLDEMMNFFKEKCEMVKTRVKDFDYKEKDDEKMKLIDDFVYKVITEKI